MNHVRISLDAGGREAAVHPMYDVFANAEFVDRATALQWNATGGDLGILNYVEGDRERFREAIDAIPEVRDYEFAPAGDRAFYAYVRDETTAPLREVFASLGQSPVVVVPPVVYEPEGTVALSAFGPSSALQAAIGGLPEPIEVSVEAVTGMRRLPGVDESLLTDRQREALEAALAVGYYDVPRAGSHEDVADAMDCAPSTAAEHLRRAEARLVRSVLAPDAGPVAGSAAPVAGNPGTCSSSRSYGDSSPFVW